MTLLIQQLAEFFNQRRRWISSTVANQINLVASARELCARSNSVSYPFVVLQFLVLLSSLISPAVVLLLLLSAIDTRDWSAANAHAFQAVFVAVPVVYTLFLTRRSAWTMHVTAWLRYASEGCYLIFLFLPFCFFLTCFTFLF